MLPCITASSPSLARAHALVASQHSPCSTFEPRHPCLGYADLQQRQRRLRRGAGAILLALSSWKHLRVLQTYTSFPGTGGTVTFRAKDGEAELTGMARQSLQGRTRSESQDRLCESAPQVIGYNLASR